MFNVIDKYRNGRTTSELYSTSTVSLPLYHITIGAHTRNIVMTNNYRIIIISPLQNNPLHYRNNT